MAPVARRAAGTRQRRIGTGLIGRYRLISIVSPLVALVVWEAAAQLRLINPLLASSPSEVAASLVGLFSSGRIWQHLVVSGSELFIGFGLAALIGIPLGLASGRSRLLGAIVSPFVIIGWVTPRIAFIPLLTLYLGFGLSQKVAVVFLMCIFPIVVMVTTGARSVSPDLLKVPISLDAPRLWVFRTVVLPASVPAMIGGLRLGFGMGVIGVVVGELYGSTSGLGFLLVNSGANFQIDQMFAAIVVLVSFGVVGMTLLSALEARFNRWRPD